MPIYRVIPKTRFNPALGASATIEFVLAREIDVSTAREAELVVRVHQAPTLTNITTCSVAALGTSISPDDPGVEFLLRNSTSPWATQDLATVTFTAFTGLPSNSGWLGVAPLKNSSATLENGGYFGGQVRIVLRFVTSTAPVVDLWISVDLVLKS